MQTRYKYIPEARARKNLLETAKIKYRATLCVVYHEERHVVRLFPAQMSLPTSKDDILAPGVLSEGVPGPVNFDFSGAPDVEGFDPTSCPSNITMAGGETLYLTRCESC